jgi:NADH-quinone oxidoreductase subunit H
MDWIIGFIILLIKLGVILVGLLLVAAYLVLVERKFLARLQIRYGPNRAGKFGLLQPIIRCRKRPITRFLNWLRPLWPSRP